MFFGILVHISQKKKSGELGFPNQQINKIIRDTQCIYLHMLCVFYS